MTLPDGKTVGIVRQGRTADGSGFAKWLWRLREEPMPGAVLVLIANDMWFRLAPGCSTHFLRVAREEMRAERVTVPLWVSHREAIDALGPLGRAWRTLAEWDSPQSLTPP